MTTRWIPTHVLDLGESHFGPVEAMLIDPGEEPGLLYSREDWSTPSRRASWRLRDGNVESAEGEVLPLARLRLILLNDTH